MSGRKQHYIPQSLIRGFAIDRGKKMQVCVYPVDRQCFVAATDGIAAERYFYSSPATESSNEVTLDDRITEYEQELSANLSRLREWASGQEIDGLLAAEVIVHLAVRTDHLRTVFADASEALIGGAVRLFATEEWARRAIGLNQSEPTDAIRETIASTWRQLLGDQAPTIPAAIEQLLFERLKEQFSANHEEISAAMLEASTALSERAREAASRGQRSSLDQSMTPQTRIDMISSLRWTAVDYPAEAQLVLPDCVALAEVKATPGLRPAVFIDSDSEVTSVLLPVTSNRLIVGQLPTKDPIGKILPGYWNSEAALSSSSFFIARTRDHELQKLTKRIGERNFDVLSPLLQNALSEGAERLADRRREAHASEPRA